QREAQCLGSRTHSECELHADGTGESCLELADRLAEREIAGGDHLPEAREDRFRARELPGQILKRNTQRLLLGMGTGTSGVPRSSLGHTCAAGCDDVLARGIELLLEL